MAQARNSDKLKTAEEHGEKAVQNLRDQFLVLQDLLKKVKAAAKRKNVGPVNMKRIDTLIESVLFPFPPLKWELPQVRL